MKSDAINLFHVVRRGGEVTAFDPSKIRTAITNAFLKDEEGKSYSATGDLGAGQRDTIEQITEKVTGALQRGRPGGGAIHIEDIQDAVELALMRQGEHRVARGFVLYRARRAAERQHETATSEVADETTLQLTGDDGNPVTLTATQALQYVTRLRPGMGVDVAGLVGAAMRELFNGAPLANFYRAIELSAKARFERHPDYDALATRILLDTMHREVLGESYAQDPELARIGFIKYVRLGIEVQRLDPRLAEFDLDMISGALQPERDAQFDYLGLGTLYDRYLIHHQKRRIETPQWLFMRVSMGLAINEVDRNVKAVEFYNVLSQFSAMNSTPTLFNAGTTRPQLSSCYLTSIADSLDSIYGGIKDNAMLQKYAGGLGNDWTRVRALGAYIKGTNGESQGVIPYLKVVNDTAIAVNQGGKRPGAVCAYLETWHMDIEEFLDLRKNTGDDRRRTHDMNTANWIPDLFMQRVQEGANWTLLSPEEVPHLHELWGQRFERAYVEAEARAQAGEIRSRQVSAVDLWRKMLTMLFETGHPWLTFKDACNVRSPQQHAGVVHSSNLCTEITLNTSDEEIAVCNLASINLAAHVRGTERVGTDLPDILDLEKLKRTVSTVMRMLDNVIDLNLYAVEKARRSNLRHRPVGLGCMGFQDALHKLQLAWSDDKAQTFADWAQQAISAYAIQASSELARERGRYSSYAGSLWSRGILPQDSMALLEQERGAMTVVNYQGRDQRIIGVEHPALPWAEVRAHVAQHGMRNSNCLAIAPTATISNIVGVDQSIEPMFGAISVKSNMAGEFTVVNTYLQAELEALGVWDEVMVSDLKHFDGSVQKIERVPQGIRERFKTAFEVDPSALIMLAAVRQVWIDQGQSLNVYLANPNGKKLDAIYRMAWAAALKTTYYLRTTSASQVEKSTGRGGELNAVASGPAPQCRIDDPSCEACQ